MKKLSEFLKITPLTHKIETLEKEIQNHSVSIIPELESENIWKAKYEKLESLFQEKSADFGKIEQALNNELKNRNEFELFGPRNRKAGEMNAKSRTETGKTLTERT